MLPKSLSFVDLETTGTTPGANRIIEIGIIRVENNKVIQRYDQLVNPETYVDPFIEKLTGINARDLENAPTFGEILPKVSEILSDSIFVAHSVRFDYGFLKGEFKRYGASFTSKHFCTVKLAKLLFPNLQRFNLDAIVEKFNISCEKRHRAYHDAKAIWEFFNIAKRQVKKEVFEKAVNLVLRKPSIPIDIPQATLDNLPESPGVYIFYGDDSTPLYVGKSKNIRDRVLSHFSNDYLSSTDMKIASLSKKIETIQTAGELGALLLESKLVKAHQPLLNVKLRHSRKMTVILKIQNADGYFTVITKELGNVTKDEIPNILGVFKSLKNFKELLWNLAKDNSLCPKLLNLEKTKKYCFSYQLGGCKGACQNKELPLKYNLRFDEAFYPHKIKPWRFERPIVIREKGESEEYFVVDKWCYIGSIKSEFENLEDLHKDYIFDFDTYKILNRYIFDPKNKHKISYLKS